jgi:hypothetical protein
MPERAQSARSGVQIAAGTKKVVVDAFGTRAIITIDRDYSANDPVEPDSVQPPRVVVACRQVHILVKPDYPVGPKPAFIDENQHVTYACTIVNRPEF